MLHVAHSHFTQARNLALKAIHYADLTQNHHSGSASALQAAPARPVSIESIEEPDGASPAPQSFSKRKLESWKCEDMRRLQEGWQMVLIAGNRAAAQNAFRSAVHNLHGVSSLYGGDILERLTNSLQRLVEAVADIRPFRALIELHIKACRATVFQNIEASMGTSLKVCALLETEVARICHAGPEAERICA